MVEPPGPVLGLGDTKPHPLGTTTADSERKSSLTHGRPRPKGDQSARTGISQCRRHSYREMGMGEGVKAIC